MRSVRDGLKRRKRDMIHSNQLCQAPVPQQMDCQRAGTRTRERGSVVIGFESSRYGDFSDSHGP